LFYWFLENAGREESKTAINNKILKPEAHAADDLQLNKNDNFLLFQ